MSPDEEGRKRQRLVESVSGTVAAIALALGLKIWGPGVEKHWLEELRSSGYVGAAEAARAYHFDSETPFEGFAWPRIAGAMIDFLRKERVKLPPGLAAALEKAAAGIEVIAEYAIQVRDKGGDELGEETDRDKRRRRDFSGGIFWGGVVRRRTNGDRLRPRGREAARDRTMTRRCNCLSLLVPPCPSLSLLVPPCPSLP